MSGEELESILEEVVKKIDKAYRIAKELENVEDETINRVIELINDAIKKLDDVGDMILGLAESEEELEE